MPAKRKPAPAKPAKKKPAAKMAVAKPKPAKAAPPAGPKVGAPAPAFSLPASNGNTISLASLKGRPVVLYFYPKDDTPGCTVEACEFSAQHASFEKAGAVVLGVSPDGLKSHDRFIQKFQLPFILLSDEAHKAALAYGAWAKKSMYGRQYMGIQRSTFVIDAKGRLARAWPQVSPAGHAAEVLTALKAL
jgi:peroxiredoxin Q/BCP